MAIYDSGYLAWDSKVGNRTPATNRGSELVDVIEIPSTNAITNADALHLKNYKSSTVITNVEVSSNALVRDIGVPFKVCLLGIDTLTKDPYFFTYPTGATIVDNFLSGAVKDSTYGGIVTDFFNLVSEPGATVGDPVKVETRGQGVTSRCQYQLTDGLVYSLYTNANNVLRVHQEDQTLGQVAEYSMGDLYTVAGVATGTSASNYDPSVRRSCLEFGLGLYFGTTITTANLSALGLKVKVTYKDSMVSETAYGKNYIPTSVTT